MVAYWVYLLSDPETHEPRYVGLTQNPAGRAMWHRCRPRKTNAKPLGEWFAELHEKDLRPEFTELACISGDNDEAVTLTARMAERNWIMRYGHIAKGKLLNIDWNHYKKTLNHPDRKVRMYADPYKHILPSQEAVAQ